MAKKAKKQKAKKVKKPKHAAVKKGMLLEDAILKGAKQLPGGQVTGALFKIDEGKLCGCGLGAAALGAGMISKSDLIALARTQGYLDSKGNPTNSDPFGNDSAIDVPFSESDVLKALPVPEISNKQKMKLYDIGLENCDVPGIDVVELNDEADFTFEEIAEAVAKRRKLRGALEKL